MKPYYSDESVTLYEGDCRDVMRSLADCSVDAVVTDPPYDLTANKKGGTGAASSNLDSPYGRSRISTGNGGFMGKDWDSTGVAFDPATWREVLRVLKPGGYVLAFGGSRTWHRLVGAIDDTGFEIRDSIAWLYGSGFPKSLDVAKAIDKAARGVPQGAADPTSPNHGNYRTTKTEGKRWDGDSGQSYGAGGSRFLTDTATAQPSTPDATATEWAGWGTALKPAFEPIVVARKPLIGTVVANVLEHGTGALNIDACRVGTSKDVPDSPRGEQDRIYGRYGAQTGNESGHDPNVGRWPTNVVLDESQAEALDEQTGVLTSGTPSGIRGHASRASVSYADLAAGSDLTGYGDSGGASRFFPTFRYEAKAPQRERPREGDTAHPTVKPLDLMRWLVRLVTPPGGVVLEPFLGSGTTAEACVIEGFRCIGIEDFADYLRLAVARLSKPIQPDIFGA